MGDKALRGNKLTKAQFKKLKDLRIDRKQLNTVDIPTREKTLNELDPPKPIKGGGFPPIGKAQAYKKGGKV